MPRTQAAAAKTTEERKQADWIIERAMVAAQANKAADIGKAVHKMTQMVGP